MLVKLIGFQVTFSYEGVSTASVLAGLPVFSSVPSLKISIKSHYSKPDFPPPSTAKHSLDLNYSNTDPPSHKLSIKVSTTTMACWCGCPTVEYDASACSFANQLSDAPANPPFVESP